MAQPYIGEIRMFAGNFAPAGWSFCDGQLVPIEENDALFVLIGTTYGGDGESTFALPNMQGRVPIHMGTSSSGITYQIGEMAGVEAVTLSTQQIPNHSHTLLASQAAAAHTSPAGNMLARQTTPAVYPYGTDTPLPNVNAQAVIPTGGSQPHDNAQPFLCVSFIISLFGLFPQQS